MFFELPSDPKKKSTRRKATRRKATRPTHVTRKPASAPITQPHAIPRKRPKRVLVAPARFAKILAAGDWPAGPNRKPFTHQGKRYKPWIVLQHVVTALGPKGEVVEFVEKGSPLA